MTQMLCQGRRSIIWKAVGCGQGGGTVQDLDGVHGATRRLCSSRRQEMACDGFLAAALPFVVSVHHVFGGSLPPLHSRQVTQLPWDVMQVDWSTCLQRQEEWKSNLQSCLNHVVAISLTIFAFASLVVNGRGQ
jgi:hypothetical protein